MKVIDLLNKIANGEEVPMKIQYAGYIYERFERLDHTYSYKNSEGDNFEDEWYLVNILNNEVEIIEDTPKEDKKIEKLAVNLYCDEDKTFKREVNDKINEIIDKVNGDSDE